MLRKQIIWKFWQGEVGEKSVIDRLRSLYSEMKKDISSSRSPLHFVNEEGKEKRREWKIPGTPTFDEYSTTVRCASRAAAASRARAASREQANATSSSTMTITSPKPISRGSFHPGGDSSQQVQQVAEALKELEG